VASRKKITRNLSYALTGWIAGVLATLVLGLSWPVIFPAIIRPEHYYGPGPGLLTILGLAVLAASPGAILGGFIGGRLSIEGGETGQRLIASLIGIALALPCGCGSLWVFTGY